MCQTHIKTVVNVSQSDIRERVLNTNICYEYNSYEYNSYEYNNGRLV